ncbi:restriction endonuclease subunit S [Deinococcus wulumuqiensis]|uniref:restriction endonuclease subunit S n=1 Tax=Deinococcus wulumuqiensis TaxID=980427 RepID=UPI0035E9C64E
MTVLEVTPELPAAELLRQHFDEAFSAPDGIKRLRELILTLAMQGKLVEQDLSEGESIGGDSEGLPSSWKWVSLGDVVDVLDSLRKPVTKQDRREGPYPYYGASGIVDYVDQYIFDEPLVLVGEDGAKWGKGDRTAFRIEGKTWVNNHAHVLRPHREVLDDQYVVHCLIERDLQPFITGMTVPKLNQARLNSIPIPLPPLAEQRRIVARIDQLMARCDELEDLREQQEHKRVQVHRAVLREVTAASDPAAFAEGWRFLADHFGELHATPKDLAELRGVILQLAVMGKLVPQDASEGTAAELLEQIQAEKKRLVQEGKIKAPKPLPPVTEAEQPYEVPQGWAWVRLGEVALSSDSGWSPQCESMPRVGDAWGVLKVSAVSWGRFQPEANKALPVGVEPRPETEVRSGDFLLSRANTDELVARSVVVEGPSVNDE